MENDKYKRGSVLVREEAFLHESGRFAIFFMMGRAGVGVLYLPSGEVITKNLSDMTEAEYLIEELLLIIEHLDKCDFSKPDFAPDADTTEIVRIAINKGTAKLRIGRLNLEKKRLELEIRNHKDDLYDLESSLDEVNEDLQEMKEILEVPE